jgi:hypothetical protein
MATITLERETSNYWNLIKDAGNDVKLALIHRLSEALLKTGSNQRSTKKKVETTAADLAGAWSDEEYLEPEDIIQILKSERKFKNDIMPV